MTDSSANGLDARLGRRGTEPLGVIDVRYAQEKYFRILRWLDGRNALLNHLQSRYGVEEAWATGEHPLAIPHPLSQPAQFFSTTTLLVSSGQAFSPAAEPTPSQTSPHQTAWGARPAGLAEIIAEYSSAPATRPAASTEREFRISRRPPPMLNEAQAASQISPRDGLISATERPVQNAGTSDVAKRTPAAENPATGAERKEQVGTGLSIAQREDSAVADRSKASPLPLVKPLAAPPRVEPFPDWQSAEIARRSPVDHVKAPEHRRHSQDSSVDRHAVVALEMPSPEEATTKLSSGRNALVASEIRGTSSPAERPDIIWREPPADRQAHNETTQPSSAGATQATQSNPTAEALLPRQHDLTTIQTQGSERGVEHFSPQVIRTISERVIRAITLDLKLERERRGETKWR
jgi:hypothetical protein